ncbi:unnamed protein product [Meloidogyne enterolobii]|uniref:Uncharacterized protein n=1 Tax=Meloidogyne enterolobii TaxID=390850 RepID=A0ACB0Z6S4_MELEN
MDNSLLGGILKKMAFSVPFKNKKKSIIALPDPLFLSKLFLSIFHPPLIIY